MPAIILKKIVEKEKKMIKILSIISIFVAVLSSATLTLTDIFGLTEEKAADIVLEGEVNNG